MSVHVGGRGYGHACRTPLHAIGLGGGAPSIPSSADIVSAWPTFSSQTVPLVEGVSAPTEPSVYDTVALGFAGGWNGKRYWMAYNNYNGNDQFENPSVVCSDDGNTWAAPAGGTNPLIPKPAGYQASVNYNSDARMAFVGSTMYVFTRVVDLRTVGNSGYSEELWYISSTDGVTWTAPATTGLRIPYAGGSANNLLDPAFLWTGTAWVAWSVKIVGSTGTVQMWTNTGGLGGTWTATNCTISAPLSRGGTGEKYWHLDVKPVTGGYAMCLQSSYTSTGRNSGNLYIGFSADGLTWDIDPGLPIATLQTGYDSYRGSIVQKTGGWDVWATRTTDHTLHRFSLSTVSGGYGRFLLENSGGDILLESGSKLRMEA